MYLAGCGGESVASLLLESTLCILWQVYRAVGILGRCKAKGEQPEHKSTLGRPFC